MKAWIVGIWLACPLAGVAPGASEPSEAALGFLRDLKAADKEVEECLEGSLLSRFCGDAKREAIRHRLESLGDGLRRGQVTLEVVDEKRDGDSAGVLVAALGGLNPMDVDVVALGARKQEGGWKVAPVPGSFENAVDGFDRELEKRLEVLEDWMGRERVRQVLALEKAGKERLAKRMAAAVPKELVEDGTALEVVDGFLDACQRRDLPAVLAFVAHELEGQRAEKIQETVSMGLQGIDENAGWGLLTRAGVAAVALESDSEREVLVLFYDSAGPGAVRNMEFSVGRVGGRWQVILPSILREGPFNPRRQRGWTASGELQRKYPAAFEKRHEARRGETLDGAAEMVAETLREGVLGELFCLSSRVEGMTEVEKMVVYAEAARLWGRFRDDEEVLKGKLLGTIAEGTAGVAVMHRVSASRVRAPELVPVLLTRSAEGWGFAPGVMGRGDWDRLPEQHAKDLEVVHERFFEEKDGWEKKAAAGFLKDFDEVGSADVVKLTESEARHAVMTFRGDLRDGRMKDAYRRCGLVDRSEGALEALNALRYEVRGLRGRDAEDQLMFAKVEGMWGAVSMRVVSGLGHEPDYVLYLVRKTKNGLRVMVDCGLRHVTNPGRRILNEQVWAHLEEHLEAEDVKVVRNLFAAHNKSSETDYKAWEEKNNK